MIAGMPLEQIKALIDHDHHAFDLLAKIVCSTYWTAGEVNLNSLGALDRQNFVIALEIISHRRTPGWDDGEFHALASWCRERHNLWEWMGLEAPAQGRDFGASH